MLHHVSNINRVFGSSFFGPSSLGLFGRWRKAVTRQTDRQISVNKECRSYKNFLQEGPELKRAFFS